MFSLLQWWLLGRPEAQVSCVVILTSACGGGQDSFDCSCRALQCPATPHSHPHMIACPSLLSCARVSSLPWYHDCSKCGHGDLFSSTLSAVHACPMGLSNSITCTPRHPCLDVITRIHFQPWPLLLRGINNRPYTTVCSHAYSP